MDPKTRDQLLALLKKAEADVVQDWKWPIWRPSSSRDDEDRPGGRDR
jgi:hypothetical protein